MEILSWIMGKSITESNNIYESYLTHLFSFVSSAIGYPKLHIMYLFRPEIMKMLWYKFQVTWKFNNSRHRVDSAINIIDALSQQLTFTV